jgi:hypothetical protein
MEPEAAGKRSYPEASLTRVRVRKDILGPPRRGCLATLKAKPGSRTPDQEMLEKTTAKKWSKLDT